MKYDIYTDGACSGNPGKGGIGYVILQDGVIMPQFGLGVSGYVLTTNNRMEILAVVEALRCLLGRDLGDDKVRVTVHTDSQLVFNTMTKGWARKANRDLWEKLDDIRGTLSAKADVEFVKVKGHSGDRWNATADRLATGACSFDEGLLKEDEGYKAFPKPQERPVQEGEPTVGDIVLKGESTPENRSVEVHLSNGTVVKIAPCYEGFEQYDCSRREALVTVDIAHRLNGWLHGKKL